MEFCAVANCTSSSKSSPDLSFFSFPKDSSVKCAKRKAEWVHRCAREDPINYKTSRICSKHFKLDDVEIRCRDPSCHLKRSFTIGMKCKLYLKDDAIPSVNLPLRSSSLRLTANMDSDVMQGASQTSPEYILPDDPPDQKPDLKMLKVKEEPLDPITTYSPTAADDRASDTTCLTMSRVIKEEAVSAAASSSSRHGEAVQQFQPPATSLQMSEADDNGPDPKRPRLEAHVPASDAATIAPNAQFVPSTVAAIVWRVTAVGINQLKNLGILPSPSETRSATPTDRGKQRQRLTPRKTQTVTEALLSSARDLASVQSATNHQIRGDPEKNVFYCATCVPELPEQGAKMRRVYGVFHYDFSLGTSFSKSEKMPEAFTSIRIKLRQHLSSKSHKRHVEKARKATPTDRTCAVTESLLSCARDMASIQSATNHQIRGDPEKNVLYCEKCVPELTEQVAKMRRVAGVFHYDFSLGTSFSKSENMPEAFTSIRIKLKKHLSSKSHKRHVEKARKATPTDRTCAVTESLLSCARDMASIQSATNHQIRGDPEKNVLYCEKCVPELTEQVVEMRRVAGVFHYDFSLGTSFSNSEKMPSTFACIKRLVKLHLSSKSHKRHVEKARKKAATNADRKAYAK